MKAKVQTESGQNVYLNLPAPLWEGKERVVAGVTLTGLYKGEKTGRMVARFDSQWVNNQTGVCEGERFTQIDTSTWLWYCEIAGIDPQVDAEDL